MDDYGQFWFNGEYCGVDSGYRQEHSPIRYLTLSLLRVKPVSTLPGGDFQSFLSDYNFRSGSNWLYYIQAPFGKDFSFVMDVLQFISGLMD